MVSGFYGDSLTSTCASEDSGSVALPPSSAARSQVDQGERRSYHKMKLQNLPQCNN